jgi:putative hydrolase of the HAD superfamily
VRPSTVKNYLKADFLLDGVEETLEALHGKYKLVVATKGDLLDQRRKLHNSAWAIIFIILK